MAVCIFPLVPAGRIDKNGIKLGTCFAGSPMAWGDCKSLDLDPHASPLASPLRSQHLLEPRDCPSRIRHTFNTLEASYSRVKLSHEVDLQSHPRSPPSLQPPFPPPAAPSVPTGGVQMHLLGTSQGGAGAAGAHSVLPVALGCVHHCTGGERE